LFSNDKFKEESGFYRFSTNQENLFADTLINLQDGVTPSANSIMNFNLFRLGHFNGNKEYLLQSKKMINNISDNLNDRVTDHLLWLSNSHNYSQKFYEIAISGTNAIDRANELMEKYLPNSLTAASNDISDLKCVSIGRYLSGIKYNEYMQTMIVAGGQGDNNTDLQSCMYFNFHKMVWFDMNDTHYKYHFYLQIYYLNQ
jgi:uncharacterized protein YyaL (SSP411 family)